tara:strand:- start:13 stop:264 length:252 start_codon:yes stop_codon:yes gene_type:complete
MSRTQGLINLRKEICISIQFKDGTIKKAIQNNLKDTFDGPIDTIDRNVNYFSIDIKWYTKKNCFIDPITKSEYKIVSNLPEKD